MGHIMKKIILLTCLSLNILLSDCSFESTGQEELSFGEYYPYDGMDNIATANIYFTCDTGTSYQVTVNRGNTGSTKMSGGSDSLLDYNINISGDTMGVEVPGQTSGISEKRIQIYGVLPAGQVNGIKASEYSDSLTITINY